VPAVSPLDAAGPGLGFERRLLVFATTADGEGVEDDVLVTAVASTDLVSGTVGGRLLLDAFRRVPSVAEFGSLVDISLLLPELDRRLGLVLAVVVASPPSGMMSRSSEVGATVEVS
jgi:hypothetical protein